MLDRARAYRLEFCKNVLADTVVIKFALDRSDYIVDNGTVSRRLNYISYEGHQLPYPK